MNTTPPFISIIIPIYNVENYIRDCLESVVNQTLDQVEIVCVNDYTVDRSMDVVAEFANKDSRIKIINHNQNRGLSAARNSGLDASEGDYIFFLDSDDLLATTDALEILYSAAKNDQSDEIIGGILKWREDTDEKYLDWHVNYLKEEVRAKPLKKLPQLSSNVIAVNKLIKRDFLHKHSIRFIETIRKNEDNPFSCQVHVLAENISIIPETTYIYRQQDDGSLMSTVKKTDAQYRCAYCYEIFKFIEAEDNRHKFRSMYYPMYSRQFLGSAEILNQFNPSDDERGELIRQWEKIVHLLPESFPAIPPPQRKILACLKKNEREMAWEMAITMSKAKYSGEQIYSLEQKTISPDLLDELLVQQRTNKLLKAQIQAIHESSSWQATAPIRWLMCKIRGY